MLSFRGRLTLFFVLIVVLPMVAVAALVVQVTGSSRSGKADARLAASLEAALSVYRQEVSRAEAALADDRLTDDPTLGTALVDEDEQRLLTIADQLRRDQRLSSVVIRDEADRVLARSGKEDAIARAGLLLRRCGSCPIIGSLEVSNITPEAYLAEIRELTGRDGALLTDSGAPLATTTELDGASLPASGHSKDVEIGGKDTRAATAALGDLDGLRLALLGPKESGGFLSSSPGVVAVLVLFFGVALIFVVMLLRALQGHVTAMLQAAQRIGEGDFTRTVPVVGRDEMAGLASEFNKMSGRLAEQMDELRRQRDELERSVRRIGEAFASGFDRQALLQIVVETAIEACRADYGRVTTSGGEVAEAGVRAKPTGHLRDALRAAEERAERDAGAAEARRESAHALASSLRELGDGSGAVGVLAVGRIGEPFAPGEREVFLYLVGQASASIENVALHELVSAQAVTDELTGLSNNRRFGEWIENESERAARFGHELSVLMLDVDDFKQINDTHGHPQGDEVLRSVGRILREESRGVDEPARYGGEEFVVGLPETGMEGAAEVAERIRGRIGAERVRMLEGRGSLRFTASVGVASMPNSASEVPALIAAADQALYAAKRAGKNRVETAASAKRARKPRRTTRRTTRAKASAKGRTSARRT